MSATADALTNADMKPSLTPCFLKKASLYSLRRSASGLAVRAVAPIATRRT